MDQCRSVRDDEAMQQGRQIGKFFQIVKEKETQEQQGFRPVFISKDERIFRGGGINKDRYDQGNKERGRRDFRRSADGFQGESGDKCVEKDCVKRKESDGCHEIRHGRCKCVEFFKADLRHDEVKGGSGKDGKIPD